MVSERVQRQIDGLLERAETAIAQFDWAQVRDCARAALGLDPENKDARTYLAAAERNLTGGSPEPTAVPTGSDSGEADRKTPVHPTSFANGRYEVKGFLGEGGKKRVYLSHDTRLDRDVAFALIKTEELDRESLDRITREAQAMGKLGDHPHVVPVFDIGDEANGQPYIVTQFMPGGDVEGLLEKAEGHRLPLDDALRLAGQVCQALEHAHAHGVIHRDLKPGNVWLTADGTAKLGDFGLAVSLDQTRLTRAGMMVGTVTYMPPEQAMGGEVTPRSDLYSLGAMLYEMVCGRPPFVGDESVAIITQHLNTPPVSPTWHHPDCPPGVEALILRLLEKDADKRPATATEVREALNSVASSQASIASTLAPAPVADNPLYRRTFVGRENELRQLQGAFDAAISGQGALVMVVGEPGIGKTALCEQLATHATIRGGKALVGHSYEEGSLSLPYLPFVEALRGYVLARSPEELRKELGSGATEVARIVSEVREKVAVEPRGAGDPEDDRWRLYQAITGFLRNAAAVQPLLIVMEDLHWADRGTLDLLVHISRNLSGARVLVVGTYRDVEVDRAHPLSGTIAELRRGSSFARIALRGLTPDEVHRMMCQLRGQDVPWSRAEAIHRQTEGNPLFIQEVLRYLVEEGLVVREDGRWRRTDDGGAPDAGIPEGLRDVIGKRLSRLSAECNRLLAIAAVIGRDFDLHTLRSVAKADEEALVGALEEALHLGVLEEHTRPGVLRYRFAHAFFRQTLYEEMSGPRRLSWHQQVARALEDQYSGRLDEHAAEMAEHFAQSTDRADLEKAVHYGEMAARRASAVYAYGEAVRLLQQTLDVQEVLDPGNQVGRCDLLLALGRALLPAGELRRAAEEVAPAAFVLAEGLADERRASQSCRLAMEGLSRYGVGGVYQNVEYQEWQRRADRYAPPGSSDRIYADLGAAAIFLFTGRRREAKPLAQRALALARQLDDPESLFDVLQLYIRSLSWPEDMQDRSALASEFADRPRHGVSLRTTARFLWAASFTLLASCRRDRAEALWKEIEDLGDRTREPSVILYGFFGRMARAVLDGDLEASLDVAASMTARGEELGALVFGQNNALQLRYRSLMLLGHTEEALADWGNVRDIVSPSAAQSLALATLGRTQAAADQLTRAVASITPQRNQYEPRLLELVRFLEAATILGDRDAAGTLAREMDGLAPMPVVPYVGPADFTCPARHLGATAVLLGDHERAKACYRQALEVCQEVRFRPEIALTRLQLAELLLEHYPAEKPEALEHLDFAITEFREMKMQPSLERALKHKGLLTA